MSRTFQVVITDYVNDALEPEKRILGDLAEVTALDGYSEDDLIGRVEDADAMMVYHHFNITRTTLDQLRQCRLIVRVGVGVDNVDYHYARAKGIPVANVPDYGSEEVADSAIGLALAMTRGIGLSNSRLRDSIGPWSYVQTAPLHRLRGTVFAVVGLGRIGTATALRAKALGMDVVYYDPYKPDGYDKAVGIRRAEELHELLAQATVVSLHCPLTDETNSMIDADAIAAMPDGSYLVNTSRGAVVDTSAIPEAIESGHLAGAALDVLPDEPPPEDDPLVAAWRNPEHPAHHRVIINPHVAFYSVEGLQDMRRKAAEACRRALTGQPLRNVVNAS